MINTRTLKILNEYGFGADINALESYLFNYSKACKIADIDDYTGQHKILIDILHDIKPNSIVFCEDVTEPIQFDTSYDSIFMEIGNTKGIRVLGKYDKQNAIKALGIAYKTKSVLDIVAFPEVKGLDISILYENGGLYKIYGISSNRKIYDFTEELCDLVPDTICDLEDVDIVEVRAVATTNRKIVTNDNVICATYNDIRTGENKKNIQIIATDIFFEEIETLPYKNYWHELEYIKSIGFKTVDPCLVRNIDMGIFYDAIFEIKTYLKSNSDKQDYITQGIVVKDNSTYRDNQVIMIYDTHRVSRNSTFTAKVKSITERAGKLELNIVNCKCNDDVEIQRVIVEDVYNLEEHKVKIGDKIEFKVINNKAILFT